MSTDTRERPRRTPCGPRCAGLCRPAGFADVYRDHRPRLLARARVLLDDPHLAEDVVQEALTRAWAACASFDPVDGPPIAAWLMTIMRNIVIDLARAQAVRPRLHVLAPGEGAPERATADASDAVVERMTLLDALSDVSDGHRAVLVGAVLQDRPYAAVAAELGIPVGTVKSRVHHALRGLRTRLDQPGHRRAA